MSNTKHRANTFDPINIMGDLHTLSLGAGVQSTALLICSQLGLHNVPLVDVAIFADTGDEPHWVYDHLHRLELWSDIPIHRVTAGCISEETRNKSNRRYMIPAYSAPNEFYDKGMLMRKCTTEFKIRPIEKEIRRLLGYKKGERVKKTVISMQGISFDEVQRIRPNRTKWIKNSYPLADAQLTRWHCLEIIKEHWPHPLPKRSACVFCPYHSDKEWLDLKENAPEEFARAVEYDKMIRNLTKAGANRPIFLHRSCKPLDEVDFDPNKNQLNLFNNECEGMCGV